MTIRAVVLALVLTYICPLAIGQEKSYKARVDELMAIADGVFERSNARLADDARKELQDLVYRGTEKIKSEQQMNEARVAMGRLAQAIVDRCPNSPCPAPKVEIFLTLADLRRALDKLCPLYPFC